MQIMGPKLKNTNTTMAIENTIAQNKQNGCRNQVVTSHEIRNQCLTPFLPPSPTPLKDTTVDSYRNTTKVKSGPSPPTMTPQYPICIIDTLQ